MVRPAASLIKRADDGANAPDQQRQQLHQGDKSAHAVPAVAMPEHTAQRTGNTGACAQLNRYRKKPALARFVRSNQLFATECGKEPEEQHPGEGSAIVR